MFPFPVRWESTAVPAPGPCDEAEQYSDCPNQEEIAPARVEGPDLNPVLGDNHDGSGHSAGPNRRACMPVASCPKRYLEAHQGRRPLRHVVRRPGPGSTVVARTVPTASRGV